MAIQIIYYNIIIPINSLYKCPGLSNFADILNYFAKQNKTKSIWYDDNLLTIGGIMSPEDAEQDVAVFKQLGLNAFKEINGDKHWDDLCVVSFIDGATLPCSWLEVHNDPYSTSYAWLKGKDVGIIIKPENKPMENNFKIDYIKCPECNNILNLSFVQSTCPNPLCGFNFAGLEDYLSKNDEELRKILLKEYRAKEGKEYKLTVTAIKHNMGNYLAHFIECKWGAHYNALYNDFIINFLDDINLLKIVLKSDIIKERDNTTTSKNGYKMFWELYCHLKKVTFNKDISNFLKSEFPGFHLRHYTEWFLKYEKFKKEKRSGSNPKATLF